MSKVNIIPIFVPHLGCPNDCVFCNQRRITGIQEIDINNVSSIINKHIEYFKDKSVDVQIAFYGGSFTAINEDLQLSLLKIGKSFIDKKLVNSIRISTRPDWINESILNRLREYGVETIELGVQSLNEEVLLKSKRSHGIKSVYNAVELIKKYDFKLGLQQMVGLPGDNKENSIDTAKKIADLEPDFVRIYPTLIIKKTELEEMYFNGKYLPLKLETAVDIVSELILIYNVKNIKIIRIGLQSSDTLKFEKDVVAGPLHDAFRELAESELLFKIIKFSGVELMGIPTIFAKPSIVPILAGQKSANKKKIIDNYNLKDLKIRSNPELKNEIIIESNSISYRLDLSNLYKDYLKFLENKCI